MQPGQGSVDGAFDIGHTDELALFLQGVSKCCCRRPKTGRAYLGILDTLQPFQKPVRGVDDGEVDAEGLREILVDLLAFIESHNAI